MSLILDALNRSRQDVEQPPGVATQHYDDQEGVSVSIWRASVPWLALLIALMVIAWLVLDRSPQPVATVVAPGMSEPLGSRPASRPDKTAEVAAPVPRPAPRVAQPNIVTARPQAVKAAVTPTAPPAPPGAAVTDLYQQQARESVAEVAAQRPELQQVPVSRTEATAPQVVAEPAARQPNQSSDEEPIDIEKMVIQAREELGNSRIAEHPAPFIAELSQQTKNSIPTLFYERHDYSGDKSRSVVVLNGKTLKVGGSAASGVKVEEILPDSVVLNYRGTQFRLRALNSWINL